MSRPASHVALGLATGVAFGLLTIAARGVVLPLLDRALGGVTLLRVVVALAAIAVLHVVVSLWRTADRLPAWQLSGRSASIALGALIGSTAGIWSTLNARVAVPTVFADELIFISLAKGLSRGDGPLVRGVETLGYGLAYPALLAPVYALADDGADAFAAAQVTNAVVMASAGIPAYLLARMVLERSDALLVAALTVLTPLLWYTAYVMTESLFYPAFVWTAYAVSRALARPSTLLQAVALGGLVGLCTVRPQAIVLLPAAATAVGIVLVRGAERGGLRRYGLLLGGLCGLALVGGVVRLLSSASPVGAYDVLLTWPDPVELLVWTGRELGGLTLAVGVVAVVVFPIATIRMLGPAASDEERAVGAISLAFVSWMLLSVSVLDSSPYGLGWTHLRNLTAVIPLILLVGVAWVRQGMPRPALTATVGAALALLGALTVRAADLQHEGRFDAPSFLPWGPFASEVLPLDRLLVLCVAVAVVVALTTRVEWALPLSVVAAFVVMSPPIVPSETPPWGIERDDIAQLAILDREVTPHGDAIVITAGFPDAQCDSQPLALAALWTEVLNTSAQAGSLFEGDLIESTPSLSIAPDGTLLRAGAPVIARAVAIDARVPVDGVPIGRVNLRELGGELSGAPGGLRIWRTDGRVRLTDPEAARALAGTAECPP